MSNGIFVTENKRLDYQGSALTNSILNGETYKNDFAAITKKWSSITWQSLNLNETLESKVNPEIILLSRNAAPYANALRDKFPSATIQGYDTWAKR